MATRSTIAIQREDGTVAQIYCHWDGYLDHNGSILHQHYQDPAKIEQLIALGDLSSLGAEIGTKHDFDNAPRGECNFYGRDRGEKGTEARVFKSFDNYMLHAQFEEYDYIFSNGVWYVQVYGRPLVSLSAAIMEEEALDD